MRNIFYKNKQFQRSVIKQVKSVVFAETWKNYVNMPMTDKYSRKPF